MTEREQLSWLLIGLAMFDWGVTGVLAWAARQVREAALNERAQVSFVLSAAATLVAIIAASQLELFGFVLPAGFGYGLLVIAVIAISVPQVMWIVSLLIGRFR